MSSSAHSPLRPFEIVFNDEYLIAVNKIAKIVVQPSPREKITLTSLLEKETRGKVFPCHRLDRETTGLMLYAKESSIQQAIAGQFRAGKVKKKYAALVKGSPRRIRGVLEEYIVDTEGRRFGEKPKLAKTFYKVIKGYRGFSLIELEPVTGRTNQLRIQLANVGHPILGERKYAFGKDFPVNFKRLALHAFYLQFTHPVSKDKVNLDLDLASDMKAFLKVQ